MSAYMDYSGVELIYGQKRLAVLLLFREELLIPNEIHFLIH